MSSWKSYQKYCSYFDIQHVHTIFCLIFQLCASFQHIHLYFWTVFAWVTIHIRYHPPNQRHFIHPAYRHLPVYLPYSVVSSGTRCWRSRHHGGIFLKPHVKRMSQISPFLYQRNFTRLSTLTWVLDKQRAAICMTTGFGPFNSNHGLIYLFFISEIVGGLDWLFYPYYCGMENKSFYKTYSDNGGLLFRVGTLSEWILMIFLMWFFLFSYPCIFENHFVGNNMSGILEMKIPEWLLTLLKT